MLSLFDGINKHVVNPPVYEMGSSETLHQSGSKQPPFSEEVTSKPQYNHDTKPHSPKTDEERPTKRSPSRDDQAYSLSWKEFPSKVVAFFRELQEKEEFVDVTLACEGKQIFAHKVVLAASSPFFRKLFKNNPCQHPIVILNDVRYCELKPLLHYMYHGQVHIQYDQISEFLRTAKLLQVRGLTGEGKENSVGVETSPSSEEKSSEETKTEEKRVNSKSPDPLINSSHTSPSSNKRRRLSPPSPSHGENHRSREVSPVSPAPQRTSTPAVVSPSPVPSLPASIPALPPLPGLSLPLSMPSTITSLPPATSNMQTGLSSMGSHPVPASAPFPHFLSHHSSNPFQPPISEDTSDTCASDKSEERHRPDHDEEEHESSLEKMSSLANMAALKGLAGFPGPSSLMGLAASTGMVPSSDHNSGRSGPRYDFYRVRATDPRPCHLCGKIYKNAHTLRTHMEDKHSNCNGFRCVLCGTVAKSRNSLHSHMSRQHRGISTKDLPLLPMPAPWNPEMASKYIQLVGGVGEVVRQNYRRCERDGSGNEGGTLGSDASTPTSQENGTVSPYLKSEIDKDRRPYDPFPPHVDLSSYGAKPPASSLLDTYLQMMRASGMDFMHNMNEKAWEDLRQNAAAGRGGVLDLTRGTTTPSKYEDEDGRGSDHYSDDEAGIVKTNGRERSHGVPMGTRSSPGSENEEDTKWAVQ